MSLHRFAIGLDRAAFGTLLLTVLWAPWPLGSNRPWAVSVLAMLVWLALTFAVGHRVAQVGQPLGRAALTRPWVWPVSALTLFCLLLCVQLSGCEALPVSFQTISRFHTKNYLTTSLAFLGASALVLLTVRNDRRVSILLGVLFASGVAQAIVAVLLSYSGAKYELLGADFDQSGRATGTFVNPDHLAGCMEITIAAGLGWLLAHWHQGEQGGGKGWKGLAVSTLQFMLSPKMLLRLLLIAVVVALVLTRSRMGNGAFFFSLAVVGAATAYQSQRLRRPALWLVASMVFVDIIVVGQWVGLDRVVQRIQETPIRTAEPVVGFTAGATAPARQEESMEERLAVPRLSLQLVRDRPWLGHGGGTYEFAFPPFKQEGLPLNWTHAHNDYVQVAADTGLLGLAAWLLPGVLGLFRSWRLLSDRHTGLTRGVAAAAMMATVSIGLHSWVDFNLHIPANALALTILLALVFTVGSRTDVSRQASKPERQPSNTNAAGIATVGRMAWPWLALTGSAFLLAWLWIAGLAQIRADLGTAVDRRAIETWVDGSAAVPDEARWDEAMSALRRAVDAQPDNPVLWRYFGDLHLVGARRHWADGPKRLESLNSAAANYRQSLALLPADAGAWASLALVLEASGAPWREIEPTWNRALRQGPFEAQVQAQLMQVALARWQQANPSVRSWAEALFDHADSAKRAQINVMAAAYGLQFIP